MLGAGRGRPERGHLASAYSSYKLVTLDVLYAV
jgi:hypothetical protein